MRRRKSRRLVNRYGLKSMFQSVRVKLDYRDPTLGGEHGDKWEGRILLLIVAFFIFVFFDVALEELRKFF